MTAETPDVPDAEARQPADDAVQTVTRVLAEHFMADLIDGRYVCACDGQTDLGEPGDAADGHAAHQAAEVVAALDPVMRKAKAEAWDDSAAEARDRGLMHDPAMGEMWDRNPYRIEAE